MSNVRVRRAYLLGVVASVLVVQLIAADWVAWAYAWGLLCALAAIVWTYIGSDTERRQRPSDERQSARAAPSGM